MSLFPTTLIEAAPQHNNGRLEVLFIDPGVVGWESLLQGVRLGVEVVLLDAQQDGLSQMALWAGRHQDVAAVHVLSHGSTAQLNLGSLTLTTSALNERSADLAALGATLTAGGDVLLYGCNVASGDAGAQFVAQWADLTGADISASDDATGSALWGADWLLESRVGDVSTASPFAPSALASFEGLLAPVVDMNFDAVASSTGQGSNIVFTTDNWTFSGSDSYAVGTYDEFFARYLSSPGSTSDRVYMWNPYAESFSDFTFQSADGSNFDLSSFSLGATGNTGLMITAYRDGTPLISESFDLNFGYTTDQISYITGVTEGVNYGAFGWLNFGSVFNNVDEIRLSFTGSATVEIDDIVATNAVVAPAITSATYNASTGQLSVTGTNLVAANGALNDIVASKFTLTGEGGSTHTLSNTADVEIITATSFTLSLSFADQAAINQILNKNGTSSTGATTYNLAADEDWAVGADAATVIADYTGNGITVSNVAVPSITSAQYDGATGVLNVTGSGFVKLSGATNDIDANKFTFTGEGGSTYTLTDTSRAEITSGTGFSLTLSSTDKAGINTILNKNGTSSTSGTTYNLAAAEDWAAGAASAVVTADYTGNGITVSNVAVPAITSASYDGSTGSLVVTGTGFLDWSGANNDIDATKFTLTGEGGSTYTLTDTNRVDISSGTSFTLNLSSTDKSAINQLLNKNGTSARGGTTYNLAAAEDWAAGADAAVILSDFTGNGITVSNAPLPPSTTVTTAQLSNDMGDSASDFITSVAAQTVSGTLSANLIAGESVWISFDNGASWSSATSALGSNAWSSTTSLVGSNTMKVRVESSAGVGTTYSQAYTLDTTQPSAPSTPDLTSGSDLGVSSSDSITYATTPTLTGTAESGSVVAVYDTDGTTVLGTATATGGNWAITSSALTAGSHTVTAKATDIAGNVSASSSGLSITIDSTAPAVSSVAVPADGTYAAGTALDFTVNFSEAVTVDSMGGTPRLALSLDTGGTVYASYASGSGSSALTFRYTVASGDMDTNGVVVGALQANGASVTDTAGNSAILTLNNVAATSQIWVDGEAPAVSSVFVPANGSYKAGGHLDFTVNFSESTFVDTSGGTPEIALVIGATVVYATYQAGSGSSTLMFRYTLADGLTDSNGITIGSLSSNGGTLSDAAGNDTTLTLNSVGATTAVLVDTTEPSVSSVSVPADDNYKVGDNLEFTVNFGEAVVVTGTPRIALTVGAETVYASYVSGSGTSALTYCYTVESGKVDANGVTVGAMSMNGGSVRDAANNPAITTLNSVGSTTSVLVDGAAPTVTGVSSSATNAVYKVGDNIAVQVTFSENVTVTGTPQLTLETGTTDQVVNYASGSGTHTLTFNYTVQAGDTSNDLDYFSTTALALNGGTIKDSAGNQATLTLASPGAANSLSNTKSLVVDTTAPAVSNVSVPASGTYRPGDHLNFTVNFSENVTVTGAPVLDLILDTGGTVQAAYTSGSGTSALTFGYTVVVGNLDADGITLAALDLNGGALRDIADQDAVLTLNNVAPTSAVRIDNAIVPPVFVDNTIFNPVTVVQGDGYTIETIVTPRPGGGTNTTQTIAPVVVPVVDIPLGGSPQGPALLVQLPEGVGLQAYGNTVLSAGTSPASLLTLQDLIERIQGSVTPLSAYSIQTQATNFLQALPQSAALYFQTLTLTLTPTVSLSSSSVIDIHPSQQLMNSGASTALVIDASALSSAPSILLNNVDFAAVVGSAQVMGGSGSNWVVGDSASQVIFLGTGDDVLHGGGGNDTVASTTGNDRIFGDEGNDLLAGGLDGDILDGGDGDDVVQGGVSDAGSWSFSIVNGDLVSQFLPANPVLTNQPPLIHVGPWWTNSSQDRHHDDRLAFSFESIERLQWVSTLYKAVTGHLPDLNDLNLYAAGRQSESELAQLAADLMLAPLTNLSLDAQVRHVIESVWGAGVSSEALLPEAIAYVANGGTWADGLRWLVDELVATGQRANEHTHVLTQDFVSAELGWIGASGHDFLNGGAGNDRLVGGDGNDVIYGGSGTDLAAWMGQLSDYTIELSHLATGMGVLLRNVSTGEEDVLADVELLQIGARYFRLPDTGMSDLSASQPVALSDFAQEVSWQEVQLIGTQLLGSVA